MAEAAAAANAVPVSDVGPAGERLIVDKVVFNPSPVDVPKRADPGDDHRQGHEGRLVKGALVFIRSTPLVASVPTDAPTGSNGIVTYSIQPQADFPIKNSYSVQFFVKAYRSGDPTPGRDLRHQARAGRNPHAVGHHGSLARPRNRPGRRLLSGML